MSGYIEVLQTLLAMIIVSFLVLNANRSIMINTITEVEGALEEQVIAIAQDYIEESRSTTFDETTINGGVPVNIPDGFSSIGPALGENRRSDFDDFDDYDGWAETIVASGDIEYDVSISVTYFEDGAPVNTPSTLKEMTISISSSDLTNNGILKQYNFKFLRSFYAD